MKILLFFAIIFGISLANNCGGNCPTGTCPSCPCGTTKNMQDMSFWCSKYNWNQNCCKCIMSHESGGNANTMSWMTTTNNFYIGLFLIDPGVWGKCSSGKPPCDPQANTNCAMVYYGEFENSWRRWASSGKACGCI